jgi:PIN domain nuclease of toxin-antitoxin system
MRLLIDTHALLWFCEGNPILRGLKARSITPPLEQTPG